MTKAHYMYFVMKTHYLTLLAHFDILSTVHIDISTLYNDILNTQSDESTLHIVLTHYIMIN